MAALVFVILILLPVATMAGPVHDSSALKAQSARTEPRQIVDGVNAQALREIEVGHRAIGLMAHRIGTEQTGDGILAQRLALRLIDQL